MVGRRTDLRPDCELCQQGGDNSILATQRDTDGGLCIQRQLDLLTRVI